MKVIKLHTVSECWCVLLLLSLILHFNHICFGRTCSLQAGFFNQYHCRCADLNQTRANVGIWSTCGSTCALQISRSFQWEMVRLQCLVKHCFVHIRHIVTSFVVPEHYIHYILLNVCYILQCLDTIISSIKLQNVLWFGVVRVRAEEKELEETEVDVLYIVGVWISAPFDHSMHRGCREILLYMDRGEVLSKIKTVWLFTIQKILMYIDHAEPVTTCAYVSLRCS
jgi:hypothetical protein